MKKNCLLALLFLVFGYAKAQTQKDAILKSVTDYFFLERENIHVQFNKSVYMTNEQIWFKGYVFHRKKNIPFYSTVNIYANLIDESGKILETKLLYGNIGSFSGNFKLNEGLKSGQYYIQFYTNWMNNFSEDESAVYGLTVVNTINGAGNALSKAPLDKINLDIHAEGGNLIANANNTVGIHVSDCNNEPTDVTTVFINDSSGKTLQQIQINKKGYGRFNIIPKEGETYKAIVNIEEKQHAQTFTALTTGINLSVNSITAQDKTLITVSTGAIAMQAYKNKPLFLVIHKDDKALIYDIAFTDKPEVKLAVENNAIAEGLNTARIIDANNTEICQRLFYNHPDKKLNAEVSIGKTEVADINLKGTSGYPNMNISVAVLPEDTRSFDNTNDIYGSLLLLPYLENKEKPDGRYYFSELTRGKIYELDMYLMSQTSKYKWNSIVANTPKSNYPFDMGLTLKGALPSPTKDDKYSQVRLYSLTSGLDEMVNVNENSSFSFENIVIPDSSHVSFTLLRKGQKPKELTLSPQLLNNNRPFNKPYKPQPRCVTPIQKQVSEVMPNIFKESTELSEVKIEATRLKYANTMGNGNLHGYKITERQSNGYRTVVDFIRTFGGFSVNDSNGQLTIYSRMRTSVNGAQAGPIIYLDNVQLLDIQMLSNIQMIEVDEIYMSSTAIIPSIRNYQGAIKIYLNKGARFRNKGQQTPDIIVKGGFEKMAPFENVLYNSTDDEGFTNFGVVGWQPVIMTDETGAFNFDIPKTGQKKLKIIVEGFSADGKLISDIKTIEVP